MEVGERKKRMLGKVKSIKREVFCREKLFHQYLWQVPKQFKDGIRATKCRVHWNNISLGGFFWSWRIFFPFFLPTSQLSFHLWRRILWFSSPDVTLHPVDFKRINKGWRERRVVQHVRLIKKICKVGCVPAEAGKLIKLKTFNRRVNSNFDFSQPANAPEKDLYKPNIVNYM